MTDQTPPPPPPPGSQPPTGPPVTGPDPVPTSEPADSGPRRALVVGLVAVAAVIVVLAAVLVPRVVDNLKGDDVVSPEIGEPAMTDVQVYPDLRTDHREDTDVEYDQVPPVGGPHDPQWLACGVYDVPIRDENAVHDLEHGATWITHDPDLSADDVAALADKLPENGIMSPYEGLPSPVVVTVWGVQLQLEGADDPRLESFLEEYGDGSTSPEPFASCEGGLTDPSGGQNAPA